MENPGTSTVWHQPSWWGGAFKRWGCPALVLLGYTVVTEPQREHGTLLYRWVWEMPSLQAPEKSHPFISGRRCSHRSGSGGEENTSYAKRTSFRSIDWGVPWKSQSWICEEAWNYHEAHQQGIGKTVFGEFYCSSFLPLDSPGLRALTHTRLEHQLAWKCVEVWLCWLWSENINFELKKCFFFLFSNPTSISMLTT